MNSTNPYLDLAIKLNRAGGESYDEGTPMTMEQAIAQAAQYGHVPSRISSGAADPNTGYSGIWGIPTASGWIPLDKLPSNVGSTAADAYHGGPQGPQVSPVQQQASAGPIMSTIDAWRNSAGGYPPSTSGPAVSAPSTAGVQPWMMPPAASPQTQPQASSSSGAPVINIHMGPSATSNPDYPGNPNYQAPAAQSSNSKGIFGDPYNAMIGTGGLQPWMKPPELPLVQQQPIGPQPTTSISDTWTDAYRQFLLDQAGSALGPAISSVQSMMTDPYNSVIGTGGVKPWMRPPELPLVQQQPTGPMPVTVQNADGTTSTYDPITKKWVMPPVMGNLSK